MATINGTGKGDDKWRSDMVTTKQEQIKAGRERRKRYVAKHMATKPMQK